MTTDPHPLRELAHRSTDGIDVTLLWDAVTDAVTVCVSDSRRGAYFEVRPSGHRALDAYYHPYSYVDESVVRYEDERLAA